VISGLGRAFVMKRLLASVLTTILIIAMTLVAMFALVAATLKVTAIRSPVQRGFAIGIELVLGIALLLGTVWLATHLAVRIFHVHDPRSTGEPRA
jgi:hypothetical protein